MKFIEEALKYGITNNIIVDSKDQMFALYCIVELVEGNELQMEEIEKAASLISRYGLDHVKADGVLQ